MKLEEFSNIEFFRPKIALPFITIVAVTLRVLTLRFRYLLGYDPYFHLAYIEEALKAEACPGGNILHLSSFRIFAIIRTIRYFKFIF